MLVASGLAVVLGAFATRRRPGDLATAGVRLARWQEQHRAPDVDPSAQFWVRGFLHSTDAVARPLARLGIVPNAATAFALWLALWTPALADVGGRWPIAAAAVVVISALADGIDGSIAALTDRSSPFGFVLDSVADRLADAAFVLALVLVGGRGGWGAAAGGAVAIFEYTRARAAVAGYQGVGVITVGERPTRIVAAAIGLMGCGVVPRSTAIIATGTLVIVAATSVIGLIQLAAVLVRWPPAQ